MPPRFLRDRYLEATAPATARVQLLARSGVLGGLAVISAAHGVPMITSLFLVILIATISLLIAVAAEEGFAFGGQA